MKNRILQAILVSLVFAGGLTLGMWFGGDAVVSRKHEARRETRQDAEPLYYRNPMNPEITSPVPARDEMGMEYIPVYADNERVKVPGTVTIDPVTVQSMGVRTAKVSKESLSRIVRAPGRVVYDEESMTRLHPKIEGWIERLRVNRTGERVSENDILLNIYSPNLVTSQEEYLLTLRSLENARRRGDAQAIARAEQIARSSRERLTLLDVPEHQIVELEQSKQVMRTLHIHTPFRGVVTRIGVREGQYVTPGTELFMIADLSRVWVYVDVYEHELPWIKVGDRAEMTVAAAPGKKFDGEITYIYPYMESKSRTVRVRLEFPNEEGVLKPDMFANVDIFSETREEAIVVPSEAIVRSGAHERVFVVREPGKFEPREVILGLESGHRTEVLEGIDPGERVVTSGQFLIDSESRLREAILKMRKPAAGNTAGRDTEDKNSKDHHQ